MSRSVIGVFFMKASRVDSVLGCVRKSRLSFDRRRGTVSMKIGVITKAAFLLSACLLSGVASAQTLMKRDTASTIRLAPGDMIDVQVFATPELSAKARISQDGYVDLPAIGKVSVAGMTPVQAEFAVEQRLKQVHIMSDARVTILVTEYSTQGVSVLGEVTKPGTYILLGQRSLFEALAAAGGTTEKEGSTISIQHPNNPELPMETIPVDSSGSTERQQLTFVHPGDLVIVSRAKSIYVIGDVGHPGEYPLARGAQLNVLKAIALAQGTNHTASTDKTSIVR